MVVPLPHFDCVILRHTLQISFRNPWGRCAFVATLLTLVQLGASNGVKNKNQVAVFHVEEYK